MGVEGGGGELGEELGEEVGGWIHLTVILTTYSIHQNPKQ